MSFEPKFQIPYLYCCFWKFGFTRPSIFVVLHVIMVSFNSIRHSYKSLSLPIKGIMWISGSMVGVYAMNTYIGYVGPLGGPSMNPTINTAGDIAFVSVTSKYGLGDVVVAKDEQNNLCEFEIIKCLHCY